MSDIDWAARKWAYEDFEPGREIVFGPRPVTAEELVEFAQEFDPQPMHLDEEAGRQSMLGGLAASGMFTASAFMRMMCDAYLLDTTSQGSPGVDFLNFRRPVLAGDELTGKTIVLSRTPSRSRPGIGIIKIRNELTNQRGEIVCEMESAGMFLMRHPERAA